MHSRLSSLAWIKSWQLDQKEITELKEQLYRLESTATLFDYGDDLLKKWDFSYDLRYMIGLYKTHADATLLQVEDFPLPQETKKAIAIHILHKEINNANTVCELSDAIFNQDIYEVLNSHRYTGIFSSVANPEVPASANMMIKLQSDFVEMISNEYEEKNGSSPIFERRALSVVSPDEPETQRHLAL